jgi:transcriptional regulator with GAF, ATPase, and Fis domain
VGLAAWFRFWGRDGSCEPILRESLQNAGLDTAPPENEAALRYGILAFSEVNSGLIEAIHESRHRPHSSIVALAAAASLLGNGATWRLLHAGASDVVAWDGATTAARIAARLQRWHTIDGLAAGALASESLAGESPAWLALVRRIVEAARFSTAPVLLTGESGTGKEILARVIHRAAAHEEAPAQRRDLVTVDCTTLVPELSGSELFGHERGAFTGAHAAREGAFALANGATLFLDEVGELPLPLQAQLLRAIHEKTYKRVGGNVWQQTDFRLVCATNQDLNALVQRGEFRLDLFHRIAGWVFRTLPIAERREDILPLALHFLRAVAPEASGIDAPVGDYLLNRAWAGNIRELRQLVFRMASRHVGPGPITAGDIPEEDLPQEEDLPRAWPDARLDRTIADAVTLGVSLREIGAAAAAAAIRIAVQSEQGNLQRAAKRLGVTDRALQIRRASGMLAG